MNVKRILSELDKSFERAWGVQPPPAIWPKWMLPVLKRMVDKAS